MTVGFDGSEELQHVLSYERFWTSIISQRSNLTPMNKEVLVSFNMEESEQAERLNPHNLSFSACNNAILHCAAVTSTLIKESCEE